MACVYFHGMDRSNLEAVRDHGLLSPRQLKKLGKGKRYGDTRTNRVYVSTDYLTARSFGRTVLCMGHLKVSRKDRNGDNNAWEVLHTIRPEYLRLHDRNSGECIPLPWLPLPLQEKEKEICPCGNPDCQIGLKSQS